MRRSVDGGTAMLGRLTPRGALVAGVVASLAACVGGAGPAGPAAAPVAAPSPSPAVSPSPSPSPLEEIVDTRFVRAHNHTSAYEEGWYVEIATIDGAPAMVDWVVFTPDWHDHRIGIGGMGGEPTAEHPSFRVVWEPGRLSMWNPAFEEDCGTPWVDIGIDAGPGGLGESWPIADEAPPIMPLVMLEPGRNQAREIADGEFTMKVRVGDALPAASDYHRGPEFQELLDREVEARVVADLDTYTPWIESITVDLSDVLLEATGETTGLVMTWELGIGDLSIPWDPPVDVAHPGCVQERHEV